MVCEKCGVVGEGEDALMDYCDECGKNLCNKCMAEGCCDHVPAKSGMKLSLDDDDDLT